MGYTKEEIIKKCKIELNNPCDFYKANLVNYRSRTTDTDEYISEIVCKFLIDNLHSYTNGISKIRREKSYKTCTHNGEYSSDSNRLEEKIAIDMFNFSQKQNVSFDYIGRIIDYQTPLKSKRNDSAGKVDLLGYDGKCLRILELKEPASNETMLKCVLESYTYLKRADTDKLLRNFGLPEDTIVKACAFVFANGVQYEEMQENRKYLKTLMSKLCVEAFYISKQNQCYKVMKK